MADDATPWPQLAAAFPSAQMVVAYGSRVSSQGAASQADASRLVDLLVVCDDTTAFHRLNASLHPQHYAGLWLPRSWLLGGEGKGPVFFPFAQLANYNCKYGVVSTATLMADLTDWTALYCAGRLHKPVRILRPPASPALATAMQTNLRHALSAALILLAGDGRSVSESALFTQIAGLSYHGDVRMGVAEDPRKVENIVANNLDGFRGLYRPQLAVVAPEFQFNGPVSDALARRLSSEHLPLRLRNMDASRLRAELRKTVRWSSALQTLKNGISAGPVKSWRYALRKVRKRIG